METEDKKKWQGLQIAQIKHGGYEVLDPTWVSRDMLPVVHFASSTLDEALSFVRDNIMENARAPVIGPIAFGNRLVAAQGNKVSLSEAFDDARAAINHQLYGDAKLPKPKRVPRRRTRRPKSGRPRKAK